MPRIRWNIEQIDGHTVRRRDVCAGAKRPAPIGDVAFRPGSPVAGTCRPIGPVAGFRFPGPAIAAPVRDQVA